MKIVIEAGSMAELRVLLEEMTQVPVMAPKNVNPPSVFIPQAMTGPPATEYTVGEYTVGGINWQVYPYKGAVPDKVIGFGWELSKYAHVIEQMCSWDVYSRKRQGRDGITREFFKVTEEIKAERELEEL